MIMKVAICDDNVQEIQTIKKHLNLFEMEHDIDFEIMIYSSGEQLLKDYSGSRDFHILFLDVEMPGRNGIEIATAIRNAGNDTVRIVFVSNHPKYMQDSFNVQAFHYLQKPLLYNDFTEIMQRIIQSYQKSLTTKLLIQEDGTEELININDILYIEALKNKKNSLRFVLNDHEITTKGQLLDWKDSLEDYSFVTPYRGILVNMNHIHYINKDPLTLSSGMELPLSRRCDRSIRALFSKHILTIRH